MRKTLYLINPKSPTPSYFGAEAYEYSGGRTAQGIADLATTTVAALAPDDWQVRICDEYLESVDLDTDAHYVGLTGKIDQSARMLQLAAEFRRRGKTVIIGGPYASLSPDRVREHCDVLVVGELETIAPDLFGDLESAAFKEEYRGDQPDLATSPLPRWDLYDNDRALVGSVQTSRGCPFECEFCDVIQYVGRKQRHKPVEQILAELECLYGYGYRSVFLADDNFTVYRRRAKEVLAALADWNRRRPAGPVAFSTQVSIDAARDPEIMRLCAEAGFSKVFIGIETPNEESLKETKKRQNVGIDLQREIGIFLEHGMTVMGGMIVGFDHDGPDIFQRQHDFAMDSPIPVFTLGALVAPAATPLYDRMKESGRLVEGGSEVEATPWDTNILPELMTREQLFEGLRWLGNSLYDPELFGDRVVKMIDRLGPSPVIGQAPARAQRPVEGEALSVLRHLLRKGPREKKMWKRILGVMNRKPETGSRVMEMLFTYAQVRCLYETGNFWEPLLPEQARAYSTG